jgi:hypothetical protein
MLDRFTEFANAQAVTATAPSTDTIDSSVADRAAGHDTDLQLQVTVNTTFASAGATTLQPVLQDSADNASFADVLSGPVIPKAALTQGAQVWLTQLPANLRRYLRVNWVVGTGPFTAGNVSAHIRLGSSRQVAYPNGLV